MTPRVQPHSAAMAPLRLAPYPALPMPLTLPASDPRHDTDGRGPARVLRLRPADSPWAGGTVVARTPIAAAPGLAPGQASHSVPVADWNLLFAAVVQRLRGTADWPGATPAQLRGPLMDCAQSLDLLQAALGLERQRNHWAMQALAHAQADLAATQHELLDTREGERRARHQAQHDSLTGLPNRRSFGERLRAELQTGAGTNPPLAVLFLDLDGFKAINDLHGHQAGDRLLCVVADRLRRSVRASDMVCRLGGDEFVCLLQAPMGRQPLAQLASKLFDTIAAPMRLGALQLHVQPSIGIALCPEDGHTATQLLHRADAAMYRAKRGQSGYAFFDGGEVAGSACAAVD